MSSHNASKKDEFRSNKALLNLNRLNTTGSSKNMASKLFGIRKNSTQVKPLSKYTNKA